MDYYILLQRDMNAVILKTVNVIRHKGNYVNTFHDVVLLLIVIYEEYVFYYEILYAVKHYKKYLFLFVIFRNV